MSDNGKAKQIELQWANGVIELRECMTDNPSILFVTARSPNPQDGNARFKLCREASDERWVYREQA